MIKDFFKKPNKRKYAAIPSEAAKKDVPEGIMTKCSECRKIMYTKDLEKNLKVCMHCGFHMRMTAYERVNSLLDEDSFTSFNDYIQTGNPLNFPGYTEKIEKDKKLTNLDEAILTGKGTIEGMPVVIAIMDSHFRMGSMGSVVGEKIACAIEKAGEMRVPFLIFTASGGARMQEGTLSLMQMAKTSAALKMFSNQGGLIISVMTHPTTGGVSASFASLGDFNFAEPKALIGFAGRRVIEQTIREELPDNFQTAEFLLNHGQLDAVIERKEMRGTITKVLDMHREVGELVW